MGEKLYQILKDDHDMVKNLLREAVENEDSSKFREIKNQLNMDIEEKYFYPPMRKVDKERINESLRKTKFSELQKLVFESFKEHEEAKIILKDMDKMHWKDKDWMPKLKKLRETVEIHVEKEENLMFPKSSEKLSTLQREGIAQQIEEEKMSKRFRSIPHEKLVPLPKNIDISRDIPATRVKIPSVYAGGDVEYEDSHGNLADKENATHIRLTGIDRRSDIVVGPIEPKGMIRLTLYLDDENLPATREKSTNNRSKIFNEEYRPIRK